MDRLRRGMFPSPCMRSSPFSSIKSCSARLKRDVSRLEIYQKLEEEEKKFQMLNFFLLLVSFLPRRDRIF
jgi:hypothetical protein